MKHVMQINYQAHSREEAVNVADALRIQEGCIHAAAYSWSATAHFEVDQDIPEEALPEGCRLVPASIVAFLQRTGGQAS